MGDDSCYVPEDTDRDGGPALLAGAECHSENRTLKRPESPDNVREAVPESIMTADPPSQAGRNTGNPNVYFIQDPSLRLLLFVPHLYPFDLCWSGLPPLFPQLQTSTHPYLIPAHLEVTPVGPYNSWTRPQRNHPKIIRVRLGVKQFFENQLELLEIWVLSQVGAVIVVMIRLFLCQCAPVVATPLQFESSPDSDS
jgi:hypothetical protein